MAGVNTPLWSPTHGVPILARMLAFTFAGSMVLTLVLVVVTRRPQSVPARPMAWNQHISQAGYSINYPAQWIAQGLKPKYNREIDGVLQQQIYPDVFSAGGDIDVAIFACLPSVSQQSFAQTAESEETSRFVAGEWGIEGYEPTNDWVSGTAHTFKGSTTKDDPEGIPFRTRTVPLAGAWQVYTLGDKVLIIVATAPQEGWAAMVPIVNQMVGSLKKT